MRTPRCGRAPDWDGTEIDLLTEPWPGLPMRSFSRTRGWSCDDFDRATERLRSAGLVGDDLDDHVVEAHRFLVDHHDPLAPPTGPGRVRSGAPVLFVGSQP